MEMRGMHMQRDDNLSNYVLALWKLKKEMFEFQSPLEHVEWKLVEEIPLIPWAASETAAVVSVEAGVHSEDQWV